MSKKEPQVMEYPHPPIEFIAGVIMGATLATCDVIKGQFSVSWELEKEGIMKDWYDVCVKLNDEMVIGDLIFARGMVESYNYDWDDTSFCADGTVHCYVRPARKKKVDIKKPKESYG